MTCNLSFKTWKNEVDRQCLKLYAITPEDGGWSEADLERHFSPHLAPASFADWYGMKYDLQVITHHRRIYR